MARSASTASTVTVNSGRIHRDLPAFIEVSSEIETVEQALARKVTALRAGSRSIPSATDIQRGRDRTNRYDDPAQRYGVLYLGRDLSTALMESVFQQHQWDKNPARSIALAAALAGVGPWGCSPAKKSPLESGLFTNLVIFR